MKELPSPAWTQPWPTLCCVLALLMLFSIPREKAGKGIYMGRQKPLGSDRRTSFTWGMRNPQGQDGKQTWKCQTENKEEVK